MPRTSLNALAPGGSNEVAIRESLFAGYIQDDWRVRPRLTLNLGVRYEFTTLPKDANNRIQEITTLANCATPGVAPSLTSPCGPVHVGSFIGKQSHHQELRAAHWLRHGIHLEVGRQHSAPVLACSTCCPSPTSSASIRRLRLLIRS